MQDAIIRINEGRITIHAVQSWINKYNDYFGVTIRDRKYDARLNEAVQFS